MNRIWKIVFWFVFSLCFVFLAVFCLADRPALMRHAAKVKPYAVAFQSGGTIRRGTAEPGSVLVFFGDSSVARPPWAKRNSPSIPALLEAELRNFSPDSLSPSVLDWAFAGGRFFHYYCLLFEAEKHRPSLVIIPINWRSLGPQAPQWREKFAFHELSALVPRGEWAHPSGKSVLRLEGIPPPRLALRLLHRPTLFITGLRVSFQTTLGIQPKEEPWAEVFDNLPSGQELIARYGDERLFNQYANRISGDNSQLRLLRRLVETADRRGVKLLFYITPIHLDEMRRRPPFDAAAFRESVGSVVDATRSETTSCLDLSDLLGEEDFIDNHEHYSDEGNRKIALALASAAKEFIAAPQAQTPK